jgi:hypothetical protein
VLESLLNLLELFKAVELSQRSLMPFLQEEVHIHDPLVTFFELEKGHCLHLGNCDIFTKQKILVINETK